MPILWKSSKRIVSIHQNLRRSIADRATFLKVATVLLGTLALCKGIRPPNLWSATQAMLDYRFGFIKRGLFGEMFTDPLHLQHYVRFAIFSFAVLAGVVVLLVLMTARSRVFQRMAQGAPALVFFSSLAFTYLANLAGYFDILQLLLVLPLLLIRTPAVRFALVLIVTAVCLGIHEGFLFLFLPIVLFTFFLDWAADRLSGRTAVAFIVALSLCATGITLALATRKSLTSAQVSKLEQQFASSADYPVRTDTLLVLDRSLGDNLHIMGAKYCSPQYLLSQLSAAVEFGPVFFLLIFFAARFCRSSDSSVAKRYGLWVVLCASCGPLLMHIFGWDAARWDTYACLTAFLALLLLARELPGRALELSPELFRTVMLLVAVNMATGEVLLDVNAPHAYPFFYETTRYFFHSHGHLLPPVR